MQRAALRGGAEFGKLARLSSPSPASAPPSAKSRWCTAVGLALLLTVHAWMAVSATRQEGNTVDELPHLTAGHVMWAARDFRMQPENGNLPQRWEALPAWIAGRRLPPRDQSGWMQPNVWALGHAYFHQSGNDLAAMLWAGRAMNVVWSLATGVLVFLWTRRLFGESGAWIALLFFVFCPTFLAHGALATSDMCMTFFMLASVGLYARHLQQFGWRTGLASAIVLGLAFVAKYSAVLLPAMFALLAMVRLTDADPMGGGRWIFTTRWARARALLFSALGHAAIVVAIIWIFHDCRYLPSPDPAAVQDYTRPWSEVLASIGGPLARLLSWARHWHVLPDAYLYGFGFVIDLSQARGAFLNGETSYTGWVHFFPYAFLVKTPIGLLVAFLAAAGVGGIRWRRAGAGILIADLRRVAPLVALFAVYWTFSLTSKLNIGQRHLLPTYPVVFIATGALGWAAARWGRGWLAIAAALLALHAGASWRIRPHYLAFFNSLAGGPAEGYRHLVDSSLDWGQDLPGLAEWLRARNLPSADMPVYLSYFGTSDPEYYGIRAVPLVPLLRVPDTHLWYELRPGMYCVSATLLAQAYSPIRGGWSLALEKEYQNLRHTEPALLHYAANPDRRGDWERDIPSEKWRKMWERYENLRFTRLCYYLRAREPDAQIGYSINIYRLSAAEVSAAVGGDFGAWRTAIEQAIAARQRR